MKAIGSNQISALRGAFQYRALPMLKNKLALSTLLCFTVLPVLIFAQTLQQDIDAILKQHPADSVLDMKDEASPSPIEAKNISELKLLAVLAIRAYQMFVSSQDMSTCSFDPSCSRFGSLAIQKAGVIRGLCLTSDRLQRCNGLPGVFMHYDFDTALGKLSDPLEAYLQTSHRRH